MKRISFFLILFFFMTSAYATVGCLSSNTTYTYINPEGRNREGVPSYYHRVEADRRLTASNFCSTPVSPAQGCYIYATRDNYTSSPGTLVNYTTTNNCNLPIDDYLPILLLSIGALSFFYIKRNVTNFIS